MSNNLNLILIGCGGTGGWAYRDLQRIITLYSKDNPSTLNKLILVERDSVEVKNTFRQIFTLNDLDKNKADALFEKYTYPNIDFFPSNFKVLIYKKYLLDDPNRTDYLDHFLDFNIVEKFSNKNNLTIAISAIDNNLSRIAVHNLFKNSEFDHYIIDAGNEDTYGQTTVTTYTPHLAEKFSLKTFWEIHPEMLAYNDGVKAGPSCADHDVRTANEGVEQTMSANIINANILSDIVERIVFKKGKIPNEISFSVDSSNVSIYEKFS